VDRRPRRVPNERLLHQVDAARRRRLRDALRRRRPCLAPDA
jgi:hypothetical protein